MNTRTVAGLVIAAYTAGVASFFAASYLWLDRHLLVQR